MYVIVVVLLLFIIGAGPSFIRNRLLLYIECKSMQAKAISDISHLNFLSTIEWLRFYPLKKILLVILSLFCFVFTVFCISMSIDDPNLSYITGTVIFGIITVFTTCMTYRYIRLPYHSIPVLNHIKTKEELRGSLQGESFKRMNFASKKLSKDHPVLISDNWVIIDGYLIPRRGIYKIYYVIDNIDHEYEYIRFVYANEKEFVLPPIFRDGDELRRPEILSLLQKISLNIKEHEEGKEIQNDQNTPASFLNKLMHTKYISQIIRSRWFFVILILICFLMPLFINLILDRI